MDVVSCAVKFSVGEKIMYESPGIYIICRNKKIVVFILLLPMDFA